MRIRKSLFTSKLLLIVSMLHLSGCASIDVVRPIKHSYGDSYFRQGPGETVETRGILAAGLFIGLIVPIPLILPYGMETTKVWKKDGTILYTEKVDSRADGVSCAAFILCGSSRSEGSWGDFLFNESSMYH